MSATCNVVEAVGAGEDTVTLTTQVHLLGSDVHSGDAALGFETYPIDGTAGGTVHSYERWIRLELSGTFNLVRAYRFFSPMLGGTAPTGWTFRYGVTDTYATPVNTASSVATLSIPTTDPGRGAPNAGGSSAADDTTSRYSQWVVIQATVDTTLVSASGPAFGYDMSDNPIPYAVTFAWTESD